MKNSFKRGDKIRSYDFRPREGRGECYVEGVVTWTDANFVYFRVTREVWLDEDLTDRYDCRVGKLNAAPLPGVVPNWPGEWDGRLVALES